MAEFRDIVTTVNFAIDQFIEPQNINLWVKKYDFNQWNKKMDHDLLFDNITAIIDKNMNDQLREERRVEDEKAQQEELEKIFEDIKFAEAELDQEHEKEQEKLK